MSTSELCKIMVVDDDELLNMFFSQHLADEGFDVISVFGVQEALANLDSSIDFILLDYNLGDGTGADFIEGAKLLGLVPPIIMASANENPDFLKECFDRGITDYIVKPVNFPLLMLKIKSVLGQVRLQRLIEHKNAELYEYKAKSEQEESIAKFIYDRLVNGVSEEREGIDFYLQSSSSFSGDIGFSLTSPSGDLYILFADATGHGLSAAITLMPVVSIFKSMVSKGFGLPAILMEINRKLVSDTPDDRFVAAILMQVDAIQSEISIWNGAMPPVLWVDEGAIRGEFKSTHMALGILPDEMFDPSVEKMLIPSSGTIFCCSDGVLEQENPQGEEFGRERLIRYLRSHAKDRTQPLHAVLHEHAKTHTYSDDVSYLFIDPLRLPSHSLCNLDDKDSFIKLRSTENFRWELRVHGQHLSRIDLNSFNNSLLHTFGLQQDFCQIAFVVLSQMINNALDHGVLALDSSLKDDPDGFARYFLLRQEKLSTLGSNDYLDIVFEWSLGSEYPCLRITVSDSGKGYDENSLTGRSISAFSGRGLTLIRKLCKSVTIVPPGNKIDVELEWR